MILIKLDAIVSPNTKKVFTLKLLVILFSLQSVYAFELNIIYSGGEIKLQIYII